MAEFYSDLVGNEVNNDHNKADSGAYIWRTRGDSKVRGAHAKRDGKTYRWDTLPEGGHPGEAFGCRCWAEAVPVSLEKEMEHNSDCLSLYKILKELKAERKVIEEELREYKNRLSVINDSIKENWNEIRDEIGLPSFNPDLASHRLLKIIEK